jgi:hypothetical protein
VSRPTRATGVPVVVAAVADLLCVVAFAAGGRSEHDEHVGVLGVLTTAWPFAVGAALAWLVVATVPALAGGRRPRGISRVYPAGVVVLVGAWGGGMLLRAVTGQGTSGAFPLVALAFLAVTLLGWRAVAALVSRRARPRPSAPAP